MADTVRYVMEAMVPELEDLEARGFFSRAELAAVVRQRESHEYAFKRLAPRLSDYLRAVEYEQRLERLRLARRRARGLTGKKTVADICITRRIHFIYRRACRRFRGQLGVWAAWLRFCAATGAGKQASRVARDALAVHPRCAALWAAAAARELDAAAGGTGDAAAARALMQQGLRACAADRDAARGLWVEYFRLELVAAARLRARRQLLGIQDAGAGATDPDSDTETQQDDTHDADAALAEILQGGVAVVVLRAAVREHPDDVDLRARMLAVLQAQPDFAGRAEIEDEIYEDLIANFPELPAAWSLRAERAARQAGSPPGPPTSATVQALTDVFLQGLQAVPSTEMVEAGLAGLERQLAACPRDADAEQAIVEAGEKLCAWADERGLADARVVMARIGLTLRAGQLPRAADLAQQAAKTEPLTESASCGSDQPDTAVVQLALALRGCCEAASTKDVTSAPQDAEPDSSSDSDDDDARESLSECALDTLRALRTHPRSEALWLQAVQAATTEPRLLTHLPSQLAAVIAAGARGPALGGLGAVAGEMVRTTLLLQGLGPARRAYKTLSAACSPGGDFWNVVVDIEVDALRAGAPDALSRANIVRLFEAAVDAHGVDSENIWLRYMEFASTQASGAGQVYWKAVKMLANPDQFIATCQRLRLAA